MNKSDTKLIIIILLFCFIILLISNLFKTKGEVANVYYNNKIILKINLSKNFEYDVKGYNGNIHIIVNNNRIKVSKESSLYHLCSKQGYISNSNETITCLPNKIVIKITNSKLDVIV